MYGTQHQLSCHGGDHSDSLRYDLLGKTGVLEGKFPYLCSTLSLLALSFLVSCCSFFPFLSLATPSFGTGSQLQLCIEILKYHIVSS